MISDRLFVVDIIKAAKMHAQLYKSPVYLYQFGYRGKHSLSEHFAQSNENYGNNKLSFKFGRWGCKLGIN